MNDDDGFVLIPMKEVVRLTSLSRAEVYRKVAAGKFPQGVRLGQARIAYLLRDVRSWIRDRIRERDEALLDDSDDDSSN